MIEKRKKLKSLLLFPFAVTRTYIKENKILKHGPEFMMGVQKEEGSNTSSK